jgi:hypothetical protein
MLYGTKSHLLSNRDTIYELGNRLPNSKATPVPHAVPGPTRPAHHPFGSKAERTGFLHAMYETLPREIRDLVYAQMLGEEDILYCLRLPLIVYEDKRRQASLMSFWKPLVQIGPPGSMMREELVQIFYERSRFCIVEPHIGSLDKFLHTDIFFGTDVAPSRHIRHLALDFDDLHKPDSEKNCWSSMLSSTHRPVHYDAMQKFPERLQSLLRSLSAAPEICTIKIWFAIDNGWLHGVHRVKALFIRFLHEAMLKEGLEKWRNNLVVEKMCLSDQNPSREREDWRGEDRGKRAGHLGEDHDGDIAWFEESRGAIGM